VSSSESKILHLPTTTGQATVRPHGQDHHCTSQKGKNPINTRTAINDDLRERKSYLPHTPISMPLTFNNN